MSSPVTTERASPVSVRNWPMDTTETKHISCSSESGGFITDRADIVVETWRNTFSLALSASCSATGCWLAEKLVSAGLEDSVDSMSGLDMLPPPSMLLSAFFCHKYEIGRDSRLHGMLTLRPLYMGIISVDVPEASILPLHLVSCKTATPSF